VAVVRPGMEELAKALADEGCEVAVCENAAEGMGASLACAAHKAAQLSPGADGYLVALGDMPFIRRSSIAAVRDALAGGAALVAPYFHSRRGHPVGLSKKFSRELLALKGDEGARQLLAAHASELVKIPLGDPGVIRDIDRPEDLAPPLAV
jgi:molybdenum cofactor cytidylyltransferase